MTFDYEYDMIILSKNDYLYPMGVEADFDEDAFSVAREFFEDDYPNEEIVLIYCIDKRRI